jgi:hypothetical protein
MVINYVQKKNGEWYVFSEEDKVLGGPYDTKKEAVERLREIEYFKNNREKGMTLQQITTNLTGLYRMDQMEGKDWLVVPMIMLTEGVHNGSNGPLYYPPEELQKTPAVWNHKPIVVYHPQMNGQGISACDPDVITNRKVGVIMNTRFEKGRLRAEAWLDPDRVSQVDNRILEAIERNEMMELSTGLFTDNEDAEGEWNGEKYVAIARNYRPDHLAVLPDQVGACSIKDGAGLLRNTRSESNLPELTDMGRSLLRATGVMDSVTHNALSHDEIWQKLNAIIKSSAGDEAWVVDVYNDYFVYRVGDDSEKMYRQGYMFNDRDVEISGEPIPVERKIVYDVVSNSEGDMMDKEKLIQALVDNEKSIWTADDAAFLQELPEEKLQALVTRNEEKEGEAPKDPEPEPEPKKEDDLKQNAHPEKKEMTVDEYIANAPEGMRDMLEAGLRAHAQQKVGLIEVITKNERNPFTKEQLENKSLVELEGLSKLAEVPEQPNVNTRATVYAGEPAPVGNGGKDEEPLVAPVMNFGSDE